MKFVAAVSYFSSSISYSKTMPLDSLNLAITESYLLYGLTKSAITGMSNASKIAKTAAPTITPITTAERRERVCDAAMACSADCKVCG